MLKLVIDTDPGVDDALALLMAHRHAGAQVVALTIGAGNVGLAHTVSNALKLLDVMGADTPVFAGAAMPLVAQPEDAAFVHGRDGFGDIGYFRSARRVEPEPAALALVRLAKASPGELTYVMLGPLTNLALALRIEPTLPTLVKRLVIMGGAVTGRGNIQRLAVEFNFGFDPEAARAVVGSWPQFDLIDWEATLAHGLPTARMDAWLAATNPHAQFFRAISRKTRAFLGRLRGVGHWHAADALAMAATLKPAHVSAWELRHVEIETAPGLTRGASLVDWTGRMGRAPNARILMRYARPAFEQLVESALAGI